MLEALEGYRRAGVWLEVTTLVIPGENDDPGELRELTAWLVDASRPETPWHVSRFFPAFRMMDRPPTPLATLRRAAEIGREAGLRHVYVGNAPELGHGGHALHGLRRAPARPARLPARSAT